ncbi:MAG: DUF1801 domain-containing protein [Chloroflexi bacterium]|nr:DUF1801 domain-containing protein [Chloroflexota bacterium]
MAKTNFQSIDEYIAACPPESQAYLQEIRQLVSTLVPNAKEKISYQIAAFELNHRNLIYFAGWKKHISLYPVPVGDEAFKRQIEPYVAGKGTLKFPLDKPLPVKLIQRVVELHVTANKKKIKEESK